MLMTDGEIKDAIKAGELEATSLSDIGKELRGLMQSMNTLTTITYKVILPALLAIFVGIMLNIYFK